MLSKEKFISYLNELKYLQDVEEEVRGALKKLAFDLVEFSLDNHDTLILKLIEDSMNDVNRYISTYIYETDWGKYPLDNTKFDYSDDFASVKNFEELYDFVVTKGQPKVFVIGDTHFYHTNIIKYCDRPYINIQQMNRSLIMNWNKVVGPNDIVFHLGDFGLGSQLELKKIFDKLNGKKYLILGNHDRKGGPKFFKQLGFEEVYKKNYTIGNIILSHEPITNLKDGFINIYAHIHNATPDKSYNDKHHFCSSVEKINYTPIEMKTLLGGK